MFLLNFYLFIRLIIVLHLFFDLYIISKKIFAKAYDYVIYCLMFDITSYKITNVQILYTTVRMFITFLNIIELFYDKFIIKILRKV